MKIKKKKKKSGTRVPCVVLEFLEKIQVELEFHELEYLHGTRVLEKKKKKKFLSARSL